MLVVKFFRSLIFATVLLPFLLIASNHELLQIKDISKIMKQIFDQHLDKKEMSSVILKHSFRIYIDQFDPDRMYLLEEEVRPFLQISDAEIARLMEQYKNNQFDEYERLNKVIQQAIFRSRQIRSQIEKENAAPLFRVSHHVASDGYEEWSDPDLKRPFPSNLQELQEQVRKNLVRFIANERRRYGEKFIQKYPFQLLQAFEKQIKGHEDQYLFLKEGGKPMSGTEQENAFSMHVLKALANSLDAHTSVLDPAEAYDMRVRLEKEVQGIGVFLQQTSDGDFIVSHLLKDGPAFKSGKINLGDYLLEVDGIPIKNKSLSQVMEMIRGKSGSAISLLIRSKGGDEFREGENLHKIQLIRQEIEVNEDRVQSSYEVFGNGIIGKIRLDSFYQGENGVSSEADVREAIKQLDKKGNLRGLILDLRENSGGFLSQAVKVAGLFITNGIIVVSKYFNGDEHFYRDVDGKRAYDGPLVILTSKATASAAEIVAQALQDYGVALVVGDPHTYGKGTIQSQTITETQAATYFKVTVGKYYTVSGKTPQIDGVKADLIVPSQFAHENIGEEYLDYPVKQDRIAPNYDDKLEDVASNLKSWYLRYYVPTLQHRKLLWREMLPSLRKNSEYRISRNKSYQMFLKGEGVEIIYASKHSNFPRVEDLQMNEAVDIVKDMIVLYTQKRGEGMESKDPSSAGIVVEK